jgi:hypothetical protein
MEWITTMDNSSSSNINSTAKYPIKAVIKIGKVTTVSLDKLIVKRLGITDETFFQQELCEDGIYLRIVRKYMDIT